MSVPLWTIEHMALAMKAQVLGEPGDVCGISIDTRTLEPHDAYFAIKGDVHDGHKFTAAAHSAGAAVSVVAQDQVDSLQGECGPLLVVDDVLSALEMLGRAARARTEAKIAAITGSVGKTTTKEALRTALESCGSVHASAASHNNHWGVPLTLARMPADTQFGVFEIGMNHPNEITPLVKMVKPHVAVINNVAAVHLGAFNSVDEIAQAKAEIFDGLGAEGTAVLNADDERVGLLKKIADEKKVANVVTFGETEGADTRLQKLVLHGSCSCLTASVLGHDMVVKVGAPGRHIAQNALAVLTVCQLLGADLAKAGLALADMEAVKGRGQRHKISVNGGHALLIDESYNANPTSMAAALALLGATEPRGKGRRIAVLGDMLELGPQSKELHAGLASNVRENASRVFLAGTDMQALADKLNGSVETVHMGDIDSLIPIVKEELRDGDVITVKASLGLRFARLIDALTKD